MEQGVGVDVAGQGDGGEEDAARVAVARGALDLDEGLDGGGRPGAQHVVGEPHDPGRGQDEGEHPADDHRPLPVPPGGGGRLGLGRGAFGRREADGVDRALQGLVGPAEPKSSGRAGGDGGQRTGNGPKGFRPRTVNL